MSSDTPEQNTPAPDQQATAPATVENEGRAHEAPEGTQNQPEATTAQKPSGVLKDLFKAREQKRTLESRNADLEAQLNEYRKQMDELQKRVEGVEAGAHLESGNSGEATRWDEKAVSDLVSRELARRDTEAFTASSAVEAEKWLRTREHLSSDPNAEGEIAGIITGMYQRDPSLQHIADKTALVKAAYLQWCEGKQVMPDLHLPASPSESRASQSVRPSGGSGTGGPRVWSTNEINQTMSRLSPGTEEFRNFAREVEQAHREGRIK